MDKAGLLKAFIICGLVLSMVLLTSSKTVPFSRNLGSNESRPGPRSPESQETKEQDDNDSDLAHSSYRFQRRKWKCAMKGERCGKVDGVYRDCCRGYTGCVGSHVEEMYCEH